MLTPCLDPVVENPCRLQLRSPAALSHWTRLDKRRTRPQSLDEKRSFRSHKSKKLDLLTWPRFSVTERDGPSAQEPTSHDSRAASTTQQRYEYLYRLYYTSMIQTIAITFGFILGAVQVLSVVLTSPPPHSVLLLVLLFAAGLGTSFYAARYFAAYFQLSEVMKHLGIFKLDYEILQRVDLFFVWKRFEKWSAPGRIHVPRVTQAIALVVVSAVFGWVISLFWWWGYGALLVGVTGATGLGFYFSWTRASQLLEEGTPVAT